MALGPVGNAIFVNQQTPIVSSIKADHSARFDLQNMAAQQIVNEKDKEIKEVRPTEENAAIDPDREHQRQEADEEMAQKEKKEKEENNQEEKTPPAFHHIDIRV